jgi:hypothetical protein
VYEFPGNRANTAAADILARQAATSESLLKVLTGVANARVLYHIDQTVNVVSEQILVGTSQPIKLTPGNESDPAVNGVTYINVGLILHLSAQLPGHRDDGAKPDVSLQARLSSLDQGQAIMKSKSTVVRTTTVSETQPLEFGQPRVLLGTNSNPGTALTQPVTYVIRYVFDEVHQSRGVPLAATPTPALAQAAMTPNGAKAEFPTQFEATAYEVKVTPQRMAALDGEALAREAGTAEKLLGRLAEIGETKITYGINQVVNVLSDQVTISTNKWLVTGVRTLAGPNGAQQVSSQTAHKVGLSVRFAGVWPTNADALPNVTLQIQSSELDQSGTPLSPDVKATRIFQRSRTHSESLEFNKPRVMVSIVSSDDSGKPALATVSVFRYCFSPTNRSP